MSIDATIQTLFDKLAARKAKVEELKAQSSKNWKTNGVFRQIGATSTTNIQTANADTIVELATQLELYSSAASVATKKFGVEVSAKVQGYTVEDWYTDFQKRLSTVSLREEENQLAQLEARLNQVLSPEERRRIEVELLVKDLG